MFFPVVEVLTAVAMALLLWYGGLRVLDGTLTVGVLAAFIQYTRRFFQPLQDLSEKFNLLQSAMASSERVFALLDEPVTVREPAGRCRSPGRCAARCGSRTCGSATAPDGPWVLRDVTFTASPGQTIALVGHTGAGKTTIVNLLLRFYDPERGRITVDGVDIRELSTADLRSHHRLRAAGPLSLHRRHPAQPDARRADHARGGAAGRAPGGRGPVHRAAARPATGTSWASGAGASASASGSCSASPGRWRSIPRILVLDEATSSVDAEAEAQIQRAIAELMAGRTSLVVAHRLSTILHADEILVLHHGEIRERGSHRELLAQRGLYERLYQLQLRGQEERKIA